VLAHSAGLEMPASDENLAMIAALRMEFIGTFLLCLTVATSAALSPLAPISIGGILMCVVYAGGHVSGANYNPAVSFALGLRGVLPWFTVGLYCLMQLLASLAAGGVAVLMLGKGKKGLSVIGHPAVDLERFNWGSACLVEFLYTFALVFVVLNVATTKANKGNQFFGLAIGFTVLAGACSGGPVSGGAFNPAVGFGLPLIAGEPEFIPLYFVFPLLGAAAAASMFRVTNPGEFKPKEYAAVSPEESPYGSI